MRAHDFILVLLAFCSEVFGVLSGFGASSFFVPLGSLLESFYFILALTSILHCFGNLSKVFLFRESFNKKLFLKLFLPSVLLTGLGALMLPYFSVPFLKTVLGAFLILLAVVWFLLKRKEAEIHSRWGFFLTALSGFFTGLVGTGGALRGIALNFMSLEKSSFVALSASIDFGGDFLRMIIYLSKGMMDWNQWFYIPLLGVAAFAGAQVGKKLLLRIPQGFFERWIAWLVFGSGLLMIFLPSS